MEALWAFDTRPYYIKGIIVHGRSHPREAVRAARPPAGPMREGLALYGSLPATYIIGRIYPSIA